MEADAYVVILHFMIPGGGLIGPIQSHLGLSDIKSDPGSQLSYKQLPPYYLAPILLAFPIPLVQVAGRVEARGPSHPLFAVLIATHVARSWGKCRANLISN